MRVVVDLDKVVVVLREVGDVTRATVEVVAPARASGAREATVHRLADVLGATNVGTLDPDGAARLRTEAVRFHAAGDVDEDWERRFAAACEKDGGDVDVVRARVIWPESTAGLEG